MTLRQNLRADFEHNGARRVWDIISHPGNFAVFIYRLSSAAYAHGILGKIVGTTLFRFNRFVSRCEISPAAQIGPGFNIVHPIGIVIAPVRIGHNFVVYHGVTIGQKRHGIELKEWPEIGDGVIAYTGAVIVGDIKIGDRTNIGANVVVTKDVPAGMTLVCAPYRTLTEAGETAS